jgi:integrase/recombinase XerC
MGAAALSDQTSLRMVETVRRFARRLEAAGVDSFAEATPAHAGAFIDAPRPGGKSPELATRHARRTALRALYRALRALGLSEGDPTLDHWLPPRGNLAARPLADDEVSLARISAQVLPRAALTAVRATAWALGEATAVSSEITAVRIADLDCPTEPRHVLLPGTRRHDPREGRLTAWGQQVLARRVAQLRADGADPGTLLAYGGAAPPGGPKAQASVCNALRDTLQAAGLSAEPDVRPSSLRHWAGRRAYDAGATIQQVALLLGHRSLDETATDIGLDWRQRISPSGPGGAR